MVCEGLIHRHSYHTTIVAHRNQTRIQELVLGGGGAFARSLWTAYWTC